MHVLDSKTHILFLSVCTTEFTSTAFVNKTHKHMHSHMHSRSVEEVSAGRQKRKRCSLRSQMNSQHVAVNTAHTKKHTTEQQL